MVTGGPQPRGSGAQGWEVALLLHPLPTSFPQVEGPERQPTHTQGIPRDHPGIPRNVV